MADSEEATQQSEDGESSNPVKGNFLERMKKAPPWVWIGLAIAAATLIIGWLALRNNSSSTNPLASTSGNNPNAPGSPNSPGAAPGQGQGQNSGGPYATQGEYNSLQSQIQRLQQELQSWHNSHGRGGGKGSGGHHKILQSVYTVGG